MRRSRARHVAFASFTCVASFALVALIVEGGARAIAGERFVSGRLPGGRPVQAVAVPDPVVGWVNRPDIVTEVYARDFRHRVRHDPRGVRGADVPIAKSPGTRRVVLLGDSVAWGWGVDDHEVFAHLAERELAPHVEIVNLGVPAHSTDQSLWMLETRGFRYEPDLVLLCFVLNDVEGNAGHAALGHTKPRFVDDGAGGLAVERSPLPHGEFTATSVAYAHRVYARSAFLQLLRPPDVTPVIPTARREDGARAPRRVSELDPETRARLESIERDTRSRADQISDPTAITHRVLGMIASACRERGVALLAFNVAHHHDYHLLSPDFPRPDGIERHLEPGAPPYETYVTARLREAGAALGFDVFSVDDAMLRVVLGGTGLDVGDGHLDAAGNRVVAARVAEELRARLLAR